MRNWLWMGTFAIAIGCYGGYRYLTKPAIDPPAERETIARNDTTRQIPTPKHDGDYEPSDAIEPLVVDRHPQAGVVVRGEFGTELEITPRALLTSGMKQPPRPDAEPGKSLYMPYADEAGILAIPLDPVRRILESTLPPVDIGDLKDVDPGEESETKEANPPMVHPYHPPHCPYTGGCPAPYPYRVTPRR